MNTIAPETEAMKAPAAMSRSNVSQLMVVEHGQLVGIIALSDLLNFFAGKIEPARA